MRSGPPKFMMLAKRLIGETKHLLISPSCKVFHG